MPRAVDDRKTCSKCRVEQDVAEFHRNKTAPDGLMWDCKACSLQRAAAYAQTPEAKVLRRTWAQSPAGRASQRACNQRRGFVRLIDNRKRRQDPEYRKRLNASARASRARALADPIKATKIKEWSERSRHNRKAKKADYDKKYRAENRERKREQDRLYYQNTRAYRLEYAADYSRQSWQRYGSGRHAARVQGWTDFFASLANENERIIAAHVMLALADFDSPTGAVIRDAGFDYRILADLIEDPAA